MADLPIPARGWRRVVFLGGLLATGISGTKLAEVLLSPDPGIDFTCQPTAIAAHAALQCTHGRGGAMAVHTRFFVTATYPTSIPDTGAGSRWTGVLTSDAGAGADTLSVASNPRPGANWELSIGGYDANRRPTDAFLWPEWKTLTVVSPGPAVMDTLRLIAWTAYPADGKPADSSDETRRRVLLRSLLIVLCALTILGIAVPVMFPERETPEFDADDCMRSLIRSVPVTPLRHTDSVQDMLTRIILGNSQVAEFLPDPDHPSRVDVERLRAFRKAASTLKQRYTRLSEELTEYAPLIPAPSEETHA